MQNDKRHNTSAQAECKAIARHSCLESRSSQAVHLTRGDCVPVIKTRSPVDENDTLFTLPADPMMMVKHDAFTVRKVPGDDAWSTALEFVRILSGSSASAA